MDKKSCSANEWASIGACGGFVVFGDDPARFGLVGKELGAGDAGSAKRARAGSAVIGDVAHNRLRVSDSTERKNYFPAHFRINFSTSSIGLPSPRSS